MEKELVLRRTILKNIDTENQIKICISPVSSQTLENDSIFESQVRREDVGNNMDCKTFLNHAKILFFVLVWLVSSYPLLMNTEKVQAMHQISIQKDSINSYVVYKDEKTRQVKILLEGALLPAYYGNLSFNHVDVWIQLLVVKQKPRSTSDIKSSDVISMQNVSNLWTVPLVTERLIGIVPEIKSEKTFNLDLHDADNSSFSFLRFQFKSNLKSNLPIAMGYNLSPISTDDGVIYAALVLVGLYVIIIFEIIHRTLAAMLASTVSVAILAALDARPTLHEIVSWMDIETLLLLFSMMILVTIFSETGIFDYLSILAFKKTGGQIWPLINILSIIVTILSCFLDNVTTALLVTPVTIKLCEVMHINPVPILTIAVIFGNIGGAITPIGDPPNVIIASNNEVVQSGVNFGIFTLHMGIGICLVFVVVYGLLRFIYRDMTAFQNPDPIEVQDLKRGIAALQRTAASVSSYSKDEEAVKENLIKKTVKLRGRLKITRNGNSPPNDRLIMGGTDAQTGIRNKILLLKSGITFFIVIGVLFLHSIPSFNNLGMGWTSFLGALLLLLLYGNENIEGIFARLEWCTLLFFASLFILMEALSKLGLIDYIGHQTQAVIMAVNPEARLTVAIILMLWVSASVSAFVDNLPLTTMMVKVATELANERELQLPLQPLIWALSFGACLGGNGSLIGSSSNIICAGVAEQHGYKFSFLDFLSLSLGQRSLPLCGGVLISPKYALTAAHCFKISGQYTIRAGSGTWKSGGTIVKVKTAVLHPQHTLNNHAYDIAVLELEKPLNLSTTIQPIKLAENDKMVVPGVKGIVSGYGYVYDDFSPSNTLRSVEISIIDFGDCRRSYYRLGMLLNKSMFCAGFFTGGKDSCQGDSGGPFVIDNILYGLVSFGLRCGDPNFPGVYTNVAAYKDFIRAYCKTL